MSNILNVYFDLLSNNLYTKQIKQEVKSNNFEYIEIWYNRKRDILL